MRIAYIGIKGLPSKAGADRVVEAIARRLGSRHEIAVYCSASEVPNGAVYPGVELIRAPVLPGKHAHATSLFLTSALHATTRRDFDLVHVHNVEACFVLPVLKLKYTVIATSHGQAYARDKWGAVAKTLIRLADWPYIRFADAVTSVSKSLAETYSSRYGRRVRYIPNGIDLDRTRVDLDGARDLLRANRVEPASYILFAAGRIIPTKGAALLLEAYRALETDLRLLVVGDTSQVPAHREELRRLADSRVVFVPPVGKAVLFGLVRLAHTFVFPSTVEAMSMMLMEAASLGAPIVSSDIVENATVLPQQALFFRSGDVQDLREKVKWAIDHPAAMKILGEKARTHVMHNYRWDMIVEQYEQLYQRMLGT